MTVEPFSANEQMKSRCETSRARGAEGNNDEYEKTKE